jgi:subtilisin family serine protease
VLDDSGSGRGDFTTKALEWILKQNDFPHVINMSLGGSKRNPAHEKLLWQLYRKGAAIVVASGNQGDDDRFYPAGYEGVIAVGAVDKKKTRATFSNFGANVDVCAPGVACYSAYPAGGFRLLQGTSMAAPTVAGLLTLGISYGLRKGHKAGEDLRNLVLSCLETSAEDLGDKGKDPYYGFGCIDGRGFFSKLEQRL